MIGDSEGDLLALLRRLVEKLRRALSIQHVKNDGNGLHIVEQTVRGRIEWDEATLGRTPVVVIDGREISWEDFSRMLMSFDGWQFKLEIRDPSEDL